MSTVSRQTGPRQTNKPKAVEHTHTHAQPHLYCAHTADNIGDCRRWAQCSHCTPLNVLLNTPNIQNTNIQCSNTSQMIQNARGPSHKENGRRLWSEPGRTFSVSSWLSNCQHLRPFQVPPCHNNVPPLLVVRQACATTTSHFPPLKNGANRVSIEDDGVCASSCCVTFRLAVHVHATTCYGPGYATT
jgi:hypothetical protein